MKHLFYGVRQEGYIWDDFKSKFELAKEYFFEIEHIVKLNLLPYDWIDIVYTDRDKIFLASSVGEKEYKVNDMVFLNGSKGRISEVVHHPIPDEIHYYTDIIAEQNISPSVELELETKRSKYLEEVKNYYEKFYSNIDCENMEIEKPNKTQGFWKKLF